MYIDITTKLVFYVIITLLIIKGIDYFIVNTLIYRCFKKRYESRLNQESKGRVKELETGVKEKDCKIRKLEKEVARLRCHKKVIVDAIFNDFSEGGK